MQRTFFIFLTVFALVCLTLPTTASAQGRTASVVDTTVDVSPAIRSAIDAWLAVSPPVALPYYAINYVHQRGEDTFVSLAALNIVHPTDTWHITDSSVAWIGSVLVHADQSVSRYDLLPAKRPGLQKVFAIPSFAPGGGADVRWPWQGGEKLMYGEEGVHAAGGGGAYATGFDAVDFLGGNDLGSGVASDMVFAAFAGTVDYVCSDPTTTLIRTTDTASGNRFIYAHLLDNANLIENHVFAKGASIGTVKHGSFDDNCGWAEQQDTHYHLHFGFEAANNAFRMENCILNIDTEKWTCGAKTVSPGEYLLNVDTNEGGGGISVTNPSFWDMVMVGFTQIWSDFVIKSLPDHKAMEFIYVLYNAVGLMLKIAYVMVYSNVNLDHLMAVIFVALISKSLLGLAEMFMFVIKAYKSLFPQAPFL